MDTHYTEPSAKKHNCGKSFISVSVITKELREMLFFLTTYSQLNFNTVNHYIQNWIHYNR